ncbi:protein of unknown function [Ruminococcaceae bacterium BL-4]|nr:protein of unknown function [Ruminococcaceae bacterium BL-4]
MCMKEVLVQNQVGLHARPATFFIQKANEFKSSIWVEKEERRVNPRAFWECFLWELSAVLQFVLLQTAPMRKRLLTVW